MIISHICMTMFIKPEDLINRPDLNGLKQKWKKHRLCLLKIMPVLCITEWT